MAVRLKNIEQELTCKENEAMQDLIMETFLKLGNYLGNQMDLYAVLKDKKVGWFMHGLDMSERQDTAEIVYDCQQAIGRYTRVLYCLRRYLRERIDDCHFDGLIAGPGIDEYHEIDKKICELAKRFNCEVGDEQRK